jgi:hypothetical protein
MKVDNRAAAVAGAVGGLLVSVVAGTDYAMNGGLVERHATLVDWAHAVGFALMLAGTVAIVDRYRAQVSRSGRVVLYTFATLLGVFAVVSVPGLAERLSFLEPVAGLCFLGMFVTGSWAGVALWRRTRCSRIGAALLTLGSPMIVVVVVLDVVGWFPVHAALAEIPVYLGVSVLALDGLRLRPPVALPAPVG